MDQQKENQTSPIERLERQRSLILDQMIGLKVAHKWGEGAKELYGKLEKYLDFLTAEIVGSEIDCNKNSNKFNV